MREKGKHVQCMNTQCKYINICYEAHSVFMVFFPKHT